MIVLKVFYIKFAVFNKPKQYVLNALYKTQLISIYNVRRGKSYANRTLQHYTINYSVIIPT